MHIILDKKKEEGNMNFYMATKTSNKRNKKCFGSSREKYCLCDIRKELRTNDFD